MDLGFENALAELGRRYPILRVKQASPAPGFRNRLVRDALAEGARELLFLDPSVVFSPESVERLRVHGLPFVCGLYPEIGRRDFACRLLPETTRLRFGRSGIPVEVFSCGLGFALINRDVFEAVRAPGADDADEYFSPRDSLSAEDAAFCTRARGVGFVPVADTSIRLWRTGLARYGWEDVKGERERSDDFVLQRRDHDPWAVTEASLSEPESWEAVQNPLRGPVTPLPVGFPRVRLFVRTYSANAKSLTLTLESVRASDWGEEPTVVTQPADWPVARESGARNLKRVLETAIADGCDFALLLEDDVRVGRHLRHNVFANPLVARDQCDYLGLFIPDLIADPWERAEPHMGYRLAKPRYSGANRGWERNRVWGAQGYVLSRRLMLAALERWDRLRGGQDARTVGVCGELGLPLWYTAPCLVEHAPLTSAFGTPAAYAPDFDLDFRLELRPGFQPPEDIPDRLTRPEAELLWRIAAGRDALELGTGCGRATVCLGQSARRVLSTGDADQSEAAEWVRRFGLSDKVEFRRGDPAEVGREPIGPFDLIFIDTPHDAAGVARGGHAAACAD